MLPDDRGRAYTGPRLPLEPLLALFPAVGVDWYTLGPVAQLAAGAEVSERRVHRWRRGLSVWDADRVACALGHHPATIWPEWWALELEGAA